MDTIFFPLPQRDPNSWSFERTLAYDLLIMCTFWTLFQLAVFCVPVRESFGCAKVPTFAFSKMPAGYIDSCNRVVSIAHALFCTIGALIYFASDSNMYIKCGGSTTDLEYFMIIVSTGYFVYDILCMLYLGLLDSDGSFHHGAVIIITWSLLCYD